MKAKFNVIPKMFALFRGLGASKIKGRPLFISHLVTTRCNCRCPMCLWREQEKFDEMSAEEIGSFYRDLRQNGFVQVGIWGGEPLVREDLEKILYFADQANLLTVLVTNGYYLEERLDQLAPFLDAVILSLDYADEKHDQIRNCPGLFSRVISSVETIGSRYPHIKVYLNCLLHKGNEDQIFHLAELAKQLKISLYVCPVKSEAFVESSKKVTEWKAESRDESQIGNLLLDLKSKGFPVNNSYSYLRDFLRDNKSYNCHLPKISMMVYPHGEVINCMDSDQPLGNVKTQPMKDILASTIFEDLKKNALNCNHCNNPNVVDTSFMWELKSEPLLNAVKVLLTS